MMRRPVVVAACVAAAAFVSPERAAAQRDSIDREPVDCISLRRIDSTNVVDDRTILFYMRGGDLAYVNELSRDCQRLEREGRFSYESRTGRLCTSDTVTVIESFGARLQDGATCPLGQFAPLTRDAADALAEGPEGSQDDDEVGVEKVELPDDEEASGSDASGAGGDDGE